MPVVDPVQADLATVGQLQNLRTSVSLQLKLTLGFFTACSSLCDLLKMNNRGKYKIDKLKILVRAKKLISSHLSPVSDVWQGGADDTGQNGLESGFEAPERWPIVLV